MEEEEKKRNRVARIERGFYAHRDHTDSNFSNYL